MRRPGRRTSRVGEDDGGQHQGAAEMGRSGQTRELFKTDMMKWIVGGEKEDGDNDPSGGKRWRACGVVSNSLGGQIRSDGV